MLKILLYIIGFCLVVGLIMTLIPFVLVFLAIYFIINLCFELYYKGKKFKAIKDSITNYINECNELNEHIEELKKSYNKIYNPRSYGHAEYANTSKYKYKKPFLKQENYSTQVKNVSITICKNAQEEPIKYLVKYFDIAKTEETLNYFEKILNDFSAAEQGKQVLKDKEESILASISDKVPFIIRKFDNKRLQKKIGFNPIDFSQYYFPKFTFQYVSPGGNSSNKVDIILDLNNLNDLVEYLAEQIKYNKSAKKQRTLMTLKLRDKIKERDNYTCRICGISPTQEPHLLLEIDHIVPIAKGGLSTEDNLQTLCWKCNRIKGAKIVEDIKNR